MYSWADQKTRGEVAACARAATASARKRCTSSVARARGVVVSGKISKTAHQQHVVLDDDFEKAPECKHKQWVKEMKLLYEKDDGTVHRPVDVAWCDDCADGEGGVESAMIGWTYECESWSSHMPSRCGKLDYSRCYPYPITDVEQMVEDYAVAKEAGQLPWG